MGNRSLRMVSHDAETSSPIPIVKTATTGRVSATVCGLTSPPRRLYEADFTES